MINKSVIFQAAFQGRNLKLYGTSRVADTPTCENFCKFLKFEFEPFSLLKDILNFTWISTTVDILITVFYNRIIFFQTYLRLTLQGLFVLSMSITSKM